MRLAPAARFVTPVLLTCLGAAQSLVRPEDVSAARETFAVAASAPRLRCSIAPVRPALDYALRIRAGYTADLPLQQLAGSGHSLAVLLRVTPDGHRPVYLELAGSLPPVPDAKLEGEMQGTFVVGEGSYTVEALLKDEAGSACLGKWRIEAKRPANERGLEPATQPMTVEDLSGDTAPSRQVRLPPRVDRMTILLQASAARPGAAKLEPEVVRAMANSLRAICRNLAGTSVRLLVFNAEQQRVLLEKRDFTTDAIPDVRTVLDQLELARVDYRTLQNSEKAELFRELIANEERADPAASAVVLLSMRGALKIDPALQHDERALARSRWYYLQYDPVFRLAPRTAFANGRGDVDATGPAGGRRGGPAAGGRGMPSWNPPAVARAPDPAEQFFRRIRGETFTIRTPGNLAAALSRMASELQ